jgi:hypothetical protein
MKVREMTCPLGHVSKQRARYGEQLVMCTYCPDNSTYLDEYMAKQEDE